ncbi:MAG: hypothetical protein JSU58_07635 [Dehalococcoidales bacterium]|nr:MAG: hypothetical protein JSU58_07635 [Dehalococcoidales bacterium]
MTKQVEIKVLNPRGVIESSPTYAPAPRINDLAGKTVGLYSNGKDGMDRFYTVFAELLKEKYPTAKTTYLSGDYLINDKDVNEWIPQIDTFIYGVGD